MNEERIEFYNLSVDEKKVLLEVFGFDVDGNGLIFEKGSGEKHICPISNEQVFVENASILPGPLPGSVIIMNTTKLTMAEYMSKFRV